MDIVTTGRITYESMVWEMEMQVGGNLVANALLVPLIFV